MDKSKDIASHLPDNQDLRDRAIRLFTFLREMTELRTTTVRSLEQYEKVLWLSEIPREPGCHCVAWGPVEDHEQSEVWVEIKKPRLKPPPKLPDELMPWLDPREVEDSSRDLPKLRERITETVASERGEGGDAEPRTTLRELGECPEIKALWERYVQDKWWPWAEEDRRLQAVQRVYTDLFSIYQKQQRLGEAYEVMLGLGYLTWRTPSGQEVDRHIITAQTSLTFDAARGVITLGPAGEGARPTLEQDMLEPQERPDVKEQNAIERQVIDIGDALWDGTQVQVALKAWVHAVSARGQFDQTLIPQTEVGSDPRIHLAPAVILRRRTERSLLRVFQEIIEQLRSGKPVPPGVRRLVMIMDDPSFTADDGSAEEGGSQLRTEPKEIYFPLPANNQQLEIVQKLATRQGVLVQGPPGTGKSHSITNLMCHLLASGQRVLVTSHTARALRVLRDKFPSEVVALCVMLLGDDLDAMQALEDSVQGITGRFNNWDEKGDRRLIAECEAKLEEARRAEASILRELRIIREADIYRHSPQFGAYEGTTQAIAKQLREDEDHYSWIAVQPNEEIPPPLSDAEGEELVRLLREINGGREEELAKDTVDPEVLATPGDFVVLVRKEVEARARYEAAADHRSNAGYAVLRRVPQDQRKILVDGLSNLRTAYEPLSHHIQSWVRKAALQVLTDQDRVWRELLTVTKQHLEFIGDRGRRSSELNISGLGERQRSVVKAQASALLQHLEAGGRLGFGPFRAKVVSHGLYLIKEVRVGGQLCDNPQTLRTLLEWIEVGEHLNVLRRQWSQHIQSPPGSPNAQIAEYRNQSALLEKVLDIQRRVEALRRIIAAIPALAQPTWHDPESLQALESAAVAVASEEDLTQARATIDEIQKRLRAIAVNPKVHPSVTQTLEAVRARDERRYAAAYGILCGLKKSRRDLEHRRALFERLTAAAPELASQMASGFTDSAWDSRMADFTAAWNWARTDRWIKRLGDPQTYDQLRRNLEHQRSSINALIQTLAATKAWGHCFSRLTEHERQHLMAWTKAMKRIGKGTGKYASMHRRAAREHMEQCRSAIPAWVMPLYRVAETIRPGTEAFDVVIVDEASQSGPEALFLQYLAKKIVVVGDDKQISPDFVGITREDVELLRLRHIRDLPHSDALGVDNSFFDQAEIRYGGRIRLREHFRCMPEIIQFSNNLCYRSEPLIPLRQHGTHRLSPVVVTHHVPDGYQKGHSPRVVNPPEVEAIVAQIAKCCDDAAYAGKSMGVISLLGEDQAKLIERRLLEKIGPEEMETRALICGDAYAFQGDERDVMFLSLVSAPTEGRRIGTLASPRDERRFNVAASRARDQMWLFHTATLNDLSSNCLRYRLLEYCQNPHVEPVEIEGLDIEELEMLARQLDRDRATIPRPFDSWFEVDVFLRLVKLGYRVLPQFVVAGYRIDLVVEGIRGRLAVECDGDVWHGADRYSEDMARQRMLERCGWTFWRVRGGTFYREPDREIQRLRQALENHKIYPTGQGARAGQGGRPTSENFRPGREAPQEGPKKGASISGGGEELFGSGSKYGPTGEFGESATDSGTKEATILGGKRLQPHLPRKPPSELPELKVTDEIEYQPWKPKPVADPRTASPDEVVQGLLDIITIEGPIVCHRLYRLYGKAAGIQRIGRQIRSLFNRAIYRALRAGLIEQQDEHGTRDQLNKIVRKAGIPAVSRRTRGDRTLNEIPPAEIATNMRLIRQESPTLQDEELFRSILTHYGFATMTTNIRASLTKIRERYLGQERGP